MTEELNVVIVGNYDHEDIHDSVKKFYKIAYVIELDTYAIVYVSPDIKLPFISHREENPEDIRGYNVNIIDRLEV